MYRERGRRRIIYIFSIKIMETKNKKNINLMEIFPITVDGITYYVTYSVLKALVEENVATAMERHIYSQVKPIFESYPLPYGK